MSLKCAFLLEASSADVADKGLDSQVDSLGMVDGVPFSRKVVATRFAIIWFVRLIGADDHISRVEFGTTAITTAVHAVVLGLPQVFRGHSGCCRFADSRLHIDRFLEIQVLGIFERRNGWIGGRVDYIITHR